MRKFLPFIIFLTFVSFTRSQTNIPAGTIDGDTWKKENAPYYVNGDLSIIDLSIEPGVSVLFSGDFKFEVSGKLTAEGFYNDSIYFRLADGYNGRWEGISFISGSDSSLLKYCNIEKGVNQGISIEDANPQISNCRISNNDGNGLKLSNTTITLSSCRIGNNGIYGLYLNNVRLKIHNSIIAKNTQDGFYSINGNDSLGINNCVIADNKGSGVFSLSGTLVIKNSILDNVNLDIDAGSADVSYSNILDGYTGNGNISINPQFIDRSDYQLSGNSPCIDAGNPAAEYADIYFPPSQGGVRNDMGIYGGPGAGDSYPPIFALNDNFDFGNVPVDSSATAIIKIINYRDTNIVISGIELLNDVFFTDITDFVAAPGDTFDLPITFEPSRSGSFSGDIKLSSKSHGDFFVKIGGTGVVPDIDIPLVEINYSTVNLGGSDSSKITIINRGYDTLRISRISTTNSVFYSNISNLNIAPRSTSDSLSITFKPDSAKSYIDSLILISNDPDEGQLEIALKGSGHGPVIALNKDTLNFEAISLIPDTSLALIISNLGDDTLKILNIGIEQSDTLFTIIENNIPENINPGENIIIHIRYKALNYGHEFGNLKITSDDSLRNIKTLFLSGPGLMPKMVIPQNSLAFAEADFDEAQTDSFYIYNYGDGILAIDSLKIFGEQQTAFNLINNESSPLQIDAGDSLLIKVRFHPFVADTNKAVLSVFGQDRNNVSDTLFLSGIGIAGQLQLSNSKIDFGGISLDSLAGNFLIISNSGKGKLQIDSLSISGINENAFELKSPDVKDVIIEPDSSLLINIAFSPTVHDSNNAQLYIFAKSFTAIKDSIRLLGNGLAPILTLSTDSLHFGRIGIDSAAVTNLLIYNSGEENLLIDSLIIKGEDKTAFSFLQNDTSSISIKPDSSFNVPLQFSPIKQGINTAELFVLSNAYNNKKDSIILQGFVLSPEIMLSRSIILFDTVAIDANTMTTIRDSLSVINNGTDTLKIFPQHFVFKGNTSAFTINLDRTSSSIAPGDSTFMEIALQTKIVGRLEAQLIIISNDPLADSMLVTLRAFAKDKPARIAYDQTSSTPEFFNDREANLAFTIETYSNIDKALLHFKMGGENVWRQKALSKQTTSNIWSVTLGPQWFTARGLQYYVTVNHGYATTTWSMYSPQSITVTITGLTAFQITRKNFYQEISVPLQTDGLTLSTLLQEKLGAYDDTKYRIFDCMDGLNNEELKEGNDTLSPGKAYWLITKDTVSLNINDTTYSVSVDSDYRLNLRKGWNLIASPFPFPVAWTSVDSIHALRFYTANGDWAFAEILNPYLGYAVYTDKAVTVSVPPIASGNKDNLQKSLKRHNSSDWHFRISAKCSTLTDSYNFAGIKSEATNGLDQFDYPEPAPIGRYVSLYLLDDVKDWRLSTDYRHPGEDGYIFDFELNSNISDEKLIEIVPENLPEQYDWVIVSPKTKVIFANNIIKTSEKKTSYKLIVGTNDFIEENSENYDVIPTSFHLSQNYPNPFNPQTKIEYQLAHSSTVTIEIYNILGKRIKRLINKERKDAGYYQIKWDGRNSGGDKVSSGIYFLFLKTEHFKHGIKMILQR